MRLGKAVLLIGSVLLVLAHSASAQILTGSVIGTVHDDQGGVLPGATVTLTSPTALPQGPKVETSDARGQYRFTGLQPGAYGLDVTLSGFATYAEKGLQVQVNGTIDRTVAMKLATVAETITVSGESPVVD